MQPIRLSLGIIGRMVGWGLLVDAGLGLLYFLLAELILQILYTLYRLLNGVADNAVLPSAIMPHDAEALSQLLFLFGVQGLVGGALAGFLGGIVAGLVLAFGARVGALASREDRRYPRVGRLTSAVAGTFPTLLLLTTIQPPLVFSYLGGAWIPLGWVMFSAIPVCLVFGAAWWASGRVLAWLENQPDALHPSYQ
jgi:hypothetical protein